jgi:hypothetical protein
LYECLLNIVNNAIASKNRGEARRLAKNARINLIRTGNYGDIGAWVSGMGVESMSGSPDKEYSPTKLELDGRDSKDVRINVHLSEKFESVAATPPMRIAFERQVCRDVAAAIAVPLDRLDVLATYAW